MALNIQSPLTAEFDDEVYELDGAFLDAESYARHAPKTDKPTKQVRKESEAETYELDGAFLDAESYARHTGEHPSKPQETAPVKQSAPLISMPVATQSLQMFGPPEPPFGPPLPSLNPVFGPSVSIIPVFGPHLPPVGWQAETFIFPIVMIQQGFWSNGSYGSGSYLSSFFWPGSWSGSYSSFYFTSAINGAGGYGLELI